MNTNLYSCANNYKKALVRLENNLQSGRFASYTRYKKTQIWNRLCRYARQLGITIKTSIAAACLAAGLSFASPAAAQTFTHQTGAANPFNGVTIGNGYAGPAFVDIDADGDMDVFIGEYLGRIFYYQNTGSVSAPVFTAQTGGANPFNGVDVGGYSKPAFADMDGDGDMDAFIGNQNGNIVYYKNMGTPAVPVFTLQVAGANPFNGVDVGSYSVPALIDIDSDGDKDAFIGEFSSIVYYKNTGTASAPAFTLQPGGANPFNGAGLSIYASPALEDIDGDGDKDALIGALDGSISYYKNTGTAVAPVFTLQSGAANPFDGVFVGNWSTPAFVNIDSDGDIDVFIGVQNGSINYFENTTPAAPPPTFAEQTGPANPFNGVDIGDASSPEFADIDGDGDLDAFIGEYDGNINYYQNTGTALAPVFTLQTGGANPLDGVSGAGYAVVAFADIDGDGDLDAFIGDSLGIIRYFENTGTVLVPVFIERTGSANPFNGVDIGDFSTPDFVDIDGDGDMDAFIGEVTGIINYYQNTGTALFPVFIEQTGPANPFNGVDVGDIAAPTFTDIDEDGDMDAFIGEQNGNINYYQNTGTVLVPVFTEQTGAANPLNGVDVGDFAAPNFADIDGDGDLDAFAGELNGNINYFQGTASFILPLQLLSFSGSKQPGYNQLQWQTAGEVNTKWFEIERSSDGRSFTKIATVNSIGNSDNNYSINDNVVYSGKIYYRLKMVDIDSRFTYSHIIWISSDNVLGISIYPNPVKDVIIINTGNTQILKTMAGIYDVKGRLMQNILINNNQQQVNVRSLATGVYTIKFADGTVQRFMKE